MKTAWTALRDNAAVALTRSCRESPIVAGSRLSIPMMLRGSRPSRRFRPTVDTCTRRVGSTNSSSVPDCPELFIGPCESAWNHGPKLPSSRSARTYSCRLSSPGQVRANWENGSSRVMSFTNPRSGCRASVMACVPTAASSIIIVTASTSGDVEILAAMGPTPGLSTRVGAWRIPHVASGAAAVVAASP